MSIWLVNLYLVRAIINSPVLSLPGWWAKGLRRGRAGAGWRILHCCCAACRWTLPVEDESGSIRGLNVPHVAFLELRLAKEKMKVSLR